MAEKVKFDSVLEKLSTHTDHTNGDVKAKRQKALRTKRISVVVTPAQYETLQELQLAFRLKKQEQKSINSLVCEAIDSYIQSHKSLIDEIRKEVSGI